MPDGIESGTGPPARRDPPSPELISGHLEAIASSRQFKGSRRSRQFLRHVVEKAIAGLDDDLRERQLGVELFGRVPTYDTGEDAIVRVTASDVRRRLHQFYATERGSEIRIDLPTGSYMPEFHWEAVPVEPAHEDPPSAPAPVAVTEPPGEAVRKPRVSSWAILRWAVMATVLAGSAWLAANHASRRPPPDLPWAKLFSRNAAVRLVLSDPDMSAIQELLQFQISLSDYANRHYVPQGTHLDPEMTRTIDTFRGVVVPAVDVRIVAGIVELAAASGTHVEIQTARSLQLRDFKTDDNFIVLGSPRSNPWTELFEDPLDFEFVYDPVRKQEIIRNKRPKPGEPKEYIPTARGWETGQAYAMVTFAGNPNQNGHVLLISGTNAEGTEAAGKVATNTELLSRAIRGCGVAPGQHFQVLLNVRTIAGSSNTFDQIACHPLGS